MAQLNFDARSVTPATGVLEALPAGFYVATITNSEMKPTKDGTGSYLELQFQIVEPAFAANRKVTGRLNLRNANPTAQEIAYKDLSAICHAVGVLQVPNSEQLHNIPLKIKLKVRAASGEYEASNEIAAYRPMSEQVALATPNANAAPAQQAFTPPPMQAQQQQPWQQQQPQQWQQPAQQAPQQAQQQQWQQPQGQQPWQQQQAPQQQQQQQQQPQQQWQQPPAGNGQQPDWANQQVQQAAPQQQQAYQQPQQPQSYNQPTTGVNPAQGGIPPWAQGQQG